MNVLPFRRQVTVIGLLVEGNSIRSTERLTGIHRDTIMRLGMRVGEGCARLHDRLFRGLRVRHVELDEAWSFVCKKQRHLEPGEPREYGDQYAFVALDAERKVILAYHVGKRTAVNTARFALDLRDRLRTRPQLSSDGFEPYVNAVRAAFGRDADYAMLVKQYRADCAVEAARRYSPAGVVETTKVVVSGNPDRRKITTSHVERQNLTIRMQMKRFARLTIAHSKRLRNHRAAFALYAAHYNLCRMHETVGTTPAMALGVVDHLWGIADLVRGALASEEEA